MIFFFGGGLIPQKIRNQDASEVFYTLFDVENEKSGLYLLNFNFPVKSILHCKMKILFPFCKGQYNISWYTSSMLVSLVESHTLMYDH